MLPECVKNLLIINVIVYLATWVVRSRFGVDLDDYLALYFVGSDQFRPWQYITYMFMHGNFEHILFNMFALWMFGYILENFWGTKRFLIYYLVCGIGAGLFHSLVIWITSAPVLADINAFAAAPTPDAMIQLYNEHFRDIVNSQWVSEVTNAWRTDPYAMVAGSSYGEFVTGQFMEVYNKFIIGVPTVGASGAVYGILLAFGMMFPNERIYLYFMVPIKAKWFVIGYAVIELITGVLGTNDGIAHFAHLGGMLFGLLLILHWRKQSRRQGWNE